MQYELKSGHYTVVMLIKTKEGTTPFPSTNAKLVITEGTELSKVHLEQAIGERRYEALEREIYASE